MQPQKEKVRMFVLARELGMESKDLLALCQQHGLDIKNQLSTVDPDVQDQIRKLVSQPAAKVEAPPAKVAAPVTVPTPPTRPIRNLDQRQRPAAGTPTPAGRGPSPAPNPVASAAPVVAGDAAVAKDATVAKPSAAVAAGGTAPTVTASLGASASSVEAQQTTTATAATSPSPAPAADPATVQAETKRPEVATPSAAKRPATPTPATPAAAAPTASTPAAPAQPAASTPAVTTPAAAATAAAVASSASSHASTASVSPAATVASTTAASPAVSPSTTVAARPLANLNRPPIRNLNAPRPAGSAASPPKPGTPVSPPSTPQASGGQAPATPAPARPGPGTTPAVGNRPAGTGGSASGSGGPATTPGSASPRPLGGSGGPVGNRPIGGQPSRPVQTGVQPPGRGGVQRGINTPRPAGPASGPGSTGRPASPPAAGNKPTGNEPRKISSIPPELLDQMKGRDSSTISFKELEERVRGASRGPSSTPPVAPTGPSPSGIPIDDDDDPRERRRGSGGDGVPGRADRHKERAERQAKRKTEQSSRRTLTFDTDDEGYRRTRKHREKVKPQGTVARKGKIPITEPITIRSLSEAMGQKSAVLIQKLLLDGAGLYTINSAIDTELAELLAAEFGCELEIKRTQDAEQDLLKEFDQEDSPEDLQPRAPVVVVMGHVDHGKTSILDRIKGDNIVATEAGGITQVLRAWRIEHQGKPITFLDTPGHQAFTKMRERGAKVTDIAVIVCAANDGVMPQTEEAISHAKAAGVALVVAINKVDLPDANLRKTEQQLYSLGLIPDTMGGEIPFVKTSAKTGQGIDELLEQISVVAELLDLKANPNKRASGTCLEAYLSEKEGVQATLLVQNGTLRVGDIVLCGHAAGTVRQMFNDRGQPIEEAGPSVPVRILGLDEVPNADDQFVVVPEIAKAREIAETRKKRLQDKSMTSRVPINIHTIQRTDRVTELKVILKAEARGSIEAIRAELEKLVHDEVRVRILHAGIGAINLSDVQLALTSPRDTLIVGFNVVPDNEARALAEERGILIRDYNIIYNLVDDIKAALEGKLKPKEEVIQLGRAVVRETFKISRVGTIAGCYVTQGVIERSAKIRVIREGVVIYPPPDRTASLESLKRFKEDAREVREGFECGLKIAGYDDVKVNDIIECYRVDQIQRTL